MNQSSTDWIFWLAGGSLGVAGLWLLYFALWKDRARGRRRCPKCWYDLSGTDSLTCSECGRTAKSERNLFKTRRRWGLAFLAMIALASAMLVSRAPMIARGGWAFAMPTTALIMLLPWIDNQQASGDWRTAAFDELMLNRVGVNSTAARTPPMWDWQWRIIIKRGLTRSSIIRNAGYAPSVDARYWSILSCALHRGVLHRQGLSDQFVGMTMPPFTVTLSSPCVPGWPARFTIDPAPFQPGGGWPEQLEVVFAGDRVMWERIADRSCGIFHVPGVEDQLKLEFRITDSILSDPDRPDGPKTLSVTYRQAVTGQTQEFNEILTPSRDPTVDYKVRDGFEFGFIRVKESDALALRVQLSEACVAAIPEFYAYVGRATLLRGDDVVFQGSKRFNVVFEEQTAKSGAIATFRLSDAVAARVDAARRGEDDAEWRLRFDLDENQMLLWTARPGTTYWDGEIEQKIEWDEHPDRIDLH